MEFKPVIFTLLLGVSLFGQQKLINPVIWPTGASPGTPSAIKLCSDYATCTAQIKGNANNGMTLISSAGPATTTGLRVETTNGNGYVNASKFEIALGASASGVTHWTMQLFDADTVDLRDKANGLFARWDYFNHLYSVAGGMYSARTSGTDASGLSSARWSNVYSVALDATGAVKLSSGAVNGYYLTTDGSGNATWAALAACPTCLTTSGNSALNGNYIPLFDGAIDLGSTSKKLQSIYTYNVYASTVYPAAFQMATSAGSGKFLVSDGVGNGTWQILGALTFPSATMSGGMLPGFDGIGNIGSASYRYGAMSTIALSATGGTITLLPGAAPTVGYVWTATSTAGVGGWAAAPTGGTSGTVSVTCFGGALGQISFNSFGLYTGKTGTGC